MGRLVSRVRRSNLILPRRNADMPVAIPLAKVLRVIEAGKRGGDTIALTRARREWVDRELDMGYLADLER